MNAERQLGEEQVAALLARYTEGASAQEVSREFGVSAAAVMRLVRKHGIAVHNPLSSADVMKQAAELYKSGSSVQRVADQVGVSKSTMLRELKKAGVVMRQFRSPGDHPHESDQAAG
jgi:transposase-like protein